MQKKKGLSRRAANVLDTITVSGPLNASDPRLLRAAGSERALYDTLMVLRDRFLIRWDPRGLNVRPTTAGRQLIGQAYYRSMLSDRPPISASSASRVRPA